MTGMTRLVCSIALALGLCNLRAEDVTSDLLAVEKPITFMRWQRAHPGDSFQVQSSALDVQTPTSNSFCAVATAHWRISGVMLTRRIFFRIPDVNLLRVPADDGPHRELVGMCVVSEVLVQSDSVSSALDRLLPQLQSKLTRRIGLGRDFHTDLHDRYTLWGSGQWQHGMEWQRQGSRWVAAFDASHGGLISIALTAAAQDEASATSSNLSGLGEDIRQLQAYAAATQLSSPQVQRMQTLLDEADRWQRTGPPSQSPYVQRSAAFLVSWVEQCRQLPPDRHAAGLYTADILLDTLPFDIPAKAGEGPGPKKVDTATAEARTRLAATGAHFDNDPLGGTYAYAHNWLWEAFRAAPDSAPRQQAFLVLLDDAFHPSCCWSGNGFEDVIRLAPQYLRDHPQWAIRGQVLLAIADAYRDRIAAANGANGDPFGDAAQYKQRANLAYHEALRYYRAALKNSVDKDSARQALTRAWALEAGISPVEARFVRIYD
jgi:hypothetical protein